MAEKLYDTSAVIELVVKRKRKYIPGAVTIFTLIEYPPSIKYVPEIIYPTKRDYAQAIKWQITLRKQGNPLPAVDLLIAAIAFNRDMELVTLDNHFKTIRQVEPNLKITSNI